MPTMYDLAVAVVAGWLAGVVVALLTSLRRR